MPAVIRLKTVTPTLEMFTIRIRDPSEDTADPTLADVERFLSRLTFDPAYFLDVDGESDIDAGITLHGANDRIASVGYEDSLRSCFAFHFVDPLRRDFALTVSIHDLSNMHICDSRSDIAAIVRTYALSGDLDHNYSWSLNIASDAGMLYNCRLDRGDPRPLGVVLSATSDLRRWTSKGG